MSNCHYLRLEKNVGRAAIRNYLAQNAQYDWLLYIDADMGLASSDFIVRYMKETAHSTVVYCGYVLQAESDEQRQTLRFRYEQRQSLNSKAEDRSKHPDQDFHTSNFLISRSLMLQHPLDEHFIHYGYEDVLFGKTLRQQGITIRHIDNPVTFCRFENNAQFLSKTEEGLHTLYLFHEQLYGYSRLLSTVTTLRSYHLAGITRLLLKPTLSAMRKRLERHSGPLLFFSLYKLGFYLNMPEK